VLDGCRGRFDPESLLYDEADCPRWWRVDASQGDGGAMNRFTPCERLSRPKVPRGVFDEAFEREAAPSRRFTPNVQLKHMEFQLAGCDTAGSAHADRVISSDR